MSLFRKYFSLPHHEQFLFLKSLGVSLVVKIVVFTLPMRWYSKYLDQSHRTFAYNNNNEVLVNNIRIAVRRASRYSPWSTKCLVDAITAKWLLQRHGIQSTLYFGVSKDESKKLVAHAWLKCGDIFITGKKGYQKFTVVSSFA